MTDILALDDIDLTGVEDYPVDESVQLHGPPGTGKTTQSGGRVGRLIREHGYGVGDVAWCTYRKALAEDTLQRFVAWDLLDESALDELHKGPTRYINTIHAVANRCVGDLPDPAEPYHRADFCDRMGLQFWSAKPWEDTAGQLLFNVFEWMRNNCLDPSNPADVRQCPRVDDLYDKWQGDVSSAWNKWADYKAQRGLIDFHEMLEAPIEQGVAPTDRILVIDEYHDATALMAKLCEHWIQHAEIVIVAGDPNQVVNAFDGADPRFFERLDLPTVLLDKTYRVPEEHWQAATKLLSKAHDIPPVARNSNGRLIEYNSPRFERGDESGWQRPSPNRPGSPAQLRQEYGPNMLFLTRMQMQADGVGAALEKAGYLYKSQSDLNGWNTDSASTRLALFNALQKLQPLGPEAFDTGYGLSAYSESDVNPKNVVFGPDEAAAILRHAHAKTLTETRSSIEEECKAIEEEERPLSATDLHDLVENEFWTRYTAGKSSVERLNKGSLSDRDRRALKAALGRNDSPVAIDDVQTQVLTIHASKGQEATDVVVYDGISRRIRREMRASRRIEQNEWRTWYVALTRAAERLHIMRNAFEWTSTIIPSNIRDVAGGGGEVPADG